MELLCKDSVQTVDLDIQVPGLASLIAQRVLTQLEGGCITMGDNLLSLPLVEGTLLGIDIRALLDTGATHSFIDSAFVAKHLPQVQLVDIHMGVKAAGSTLYALKRTVALTVMLGSTLALTTAFYVLDNLPFPVVLGNRDLGTAGLFTISGRPSIYWWPVDGSNASPVDTGVPLLTERPLHCGLQCVLHAMTEDVVELAPYTPTRVQVVLPAFTGCLASLAPASGCLLHVLAAGDALLNAGLNIHEGVTSLDQDGCWVELYNHLPTPVVFLKD